MLNFNSLSLLTFAKILSFLFCISIPHIDLTTFFIIPYSYWFSNLFTISRFSISYLWHHLLIILLFLSFQMVGQPPTAIVSKIYGEGKVNWL